MMTETGRVERKHLIVMSHDEEVLQITRAELDGRGFEGLGRPRRAALAYPNLQWSS